MAIVDRVKNILITPKTEWDVIAGETTPTAQLITGYVLPLAAVAAVAHFLGSVFVGTGMGVGVGMDSLRSSALRATLPRRAPRETRRETRTTARRSRSRKNCIWLAKIDHGQPCSYPLSNASCHLPQLSKFL